MLRPEDKRKISENIKFIESKSGAELVAVITEKSGDYQFFWLCLNLCLVLFISSIIAFFTFISTIMLLNIQILLFMIFFYIFYRFGDSLISYLPNYYIHKKASHFANNQFKKLGINATLTRQAVMFFVSEKEKYVEIIADEAICKKVDNSFWEDIVQDFILHVKKDEFAAGFIKAINSCGDVLIEKFPIKKDDENELSDEVIEL